MIEKIAKQKFKSPTEEKIFIAERNNSYIRLCVIAINTLFYLLMNKDGTIPWLAYSVIFSVWPYTIYVLLFQPYRKYPIFLASYFTYTSDAIFILAWLLGTGGIESPFFIVWYISIIAVAFRFAFKVTIFTSFLYSSFYILLLILLNEFEGNENLILLRCSYIFIIGVLSSLITKETADQVSQRIDMEILALEAQQSEEALKTSEAKLKETIDKLIKSEQELRQNQKFNQQITEASPDMIFIFDVVKGKNVYINHQVTPILGYTQEEMLSFSPEHFKTLFHPEDLEIRTTHQEYFLKTAKEGEVKETQYRIKDKEGKWHWLSIRNSIFKRTEGGLQIIGVGHDISDKKRTEKEIQDKNLQLAQTLDELKIIKENLQLANLELELRVQHRTKELLQSEERYRFLAESIPQLVWTSDREGKGEYFNHKWFDYTGQNYEEAKGEGWRAAIHPDDRDKTVEIWQDALVSGHPISMEVRLKKIDGTYRWFLDKGLPMKDSEGNIVKWFGTCTDIQDQKEAIENLAKIQEELIFKNRELLKTNTDLDNFVYTASHDLRAPIANLEGLINVLRKKLKVQNDEEVALIFEMINTSIIKFGNTIKDLTEITKAQKDLSDDAEPLSFRDIVNDVKIDIFNLIEESRPVIIEDYAVKEILYPKNNLRSIIYNLLTNAIKYRSPRRPLNIEIRTLIKDGYIVFSVKDNGLGLNNDQKSKLFSMFKRMHTHVEGSGIGLYIIKRTIENHNGRIEVVSELDQGTTFIVYLTWTSLQ